MSGAARELCGGFDLVCAPAMGAVVFGFATALHAGRPFAFLQRDSGGQMSVRPGFRSLVDGASAFLVEDVSTTGGSVRESIRALEGAGCSVLGAGLIVDRTGGELDLGVPYEALLTVSAESWTPEDCPLCREGVPLTVPGSTGKG